MATTPSRWAKTTAAFSAVIAVLPVGGLAPTALMAVVATASAVLIVRSLGEPCM